MTSDYKLPSGRLVDQKELLKRETAIGVDPVSAVIEDVERGIVAVEPKKGDACWLKEEFLSLADSPWRVFNVKEGDYGPRVLFKRELDHEY